MTESTSNVLIVEDSDDCSETLELAFLTLKDVRLIIVRSAEEALEHFATNSVAALVTDIHLPGMDGLHLLAAVRALRLGTSVPAIVISGDSDPGTPARVLAAGADAFFSKPYSPAAVRRKLEELLAASGRNGHGTRN